MKQCKQCELAIYCFSEPGTWVFRTKQEMEEKQSSIFGCPIYRQTREEPAEVVQEYSKVSDVRS